MKIPAQYEGDEAFAGLFTLHEIDLELQRHDAPEDPADNEILDEGALEDMLLPDLDLDDEEEDNGGGEAKEEAPAPEAAPKQVGPKFKGKHSLSRDVIFSGPAFVPLNPDDYDPIYDGRGADKMSVDPGSLMHQEATDPEEYARDKQLKVRVHELIKSETGIDPLAPRRKPSRVDFNKYFRMIEHEMREDGFSKAKLFVELAHYFSDNLANMFKLLNADLGGEIVRELRQSANMRPLDDMDFLG